LSPTSMRTAHTPTHTHTYTHIACRAEAPPSPSGSQPVAHGRKVQYDDDGAMVHRDGV